MLFAIAAWFLSVKKQAQPSGIAVRYEMDSGHKRYFRANSRLRFTPRADDDFDVATTGARDEAPPGLHNQSERANETESNHHCDTAIGNNHRIAAADDGILSAPSLG